MRDGSTNLFAGRRNKNPEVFKAIDLYVAFAKGIGVDLTNGFLFRPNSPGWEIVDKPFSYSTADSRFKKATLPQ